MLVPVDRLIALVPDSPSLLDNVKVYQYDGINFVISIDAGYKLEVFPRLPKLLKLIMLFAGGVPPLVELREGDRYRGHYVPDVVAWLTEDVEL